MTAMQLTIEGEEVEYRRASRGTVPLGRAQKEVMRRLGFGSLTSTQAGVIVHEERRFALAALRRVPIANISEWAGCGHGARDDEAKSEYGGSGCCRYAATDGAAVMKRLYDRGFVEKHAGLWFAKS